MSIYIDLVPKKGVMVVLTRLLTPSRFVGLVNLAEKWLVVNV